MTRSIIFAAALALASIAAGAHAEDVSSTHLDLRSFDLNKPADAQKVYQLLSQAAHKVCEDSVHEAFTSDRVERLDVCFRQTMDDAVSRAHAPLLAAMNGRPAQDVRLAGR